MWTQVIECKCKLTTVITQVPLAMLCICIFARILKTLGVRWCRPIVFVFGFVFEFVLYLHVYFIHTVICALESCWSNGVGSLPGRSLGSQIFPFCAARRFRIIISPYHHFFTYHHVFILLYLHIHRKSLYLARAFTWKPDLPFLCCGRDIILSFQHIIISLCIILYSSGHHITVS